MNIVLRKIKDILIMLSPLFFLSLIIQLGLYLYLKDINLNLLFQFIISNIIMFIALFFLLIGLDFSILDFGEELGSKLLKKRFYFIVPIIATIGVIITICDSILQGCKYFKDDKFVSLNFYNSNISWSFFTYCNY